MYARPNTGLGRGRESRAIAAEHRATQRAFQAQYAVARIAAAGGTQ